jgi:hypothetical protein
MWGTLVTNAGKHSTAVATLSTGLHPSSKCLTEASGASEVQKQDKDYISSRSSAHLLHGFHFFWVYVRDHI